MSSDILGVDGAVNVVGPNTTPTGILATGVLRVLLTGLVLATISLLDTMFHPHLKVDAWWYWTGIFGWWWTKQMGVTAAAVFFFMCGLLGLAPFLVEKRLHGVTRIAAV